MADSKNDVKDKFKCPKYLIDAKENALKDCKILYCGTKKPPTKSLMCFGWECGNGWNREIADLSYRLEALNLIFYPRFRTRIEALQIKEKFGWFTGYFHVVVDPPAFRRPFIRFFEMIHNFLSRKIDYRYEKVVDSSQYNSEEWEEISKSDFDNKKTPKYSENEYGWKFKEEDGKYFRNYSLYHPEKSHREPRKHRILHALKEFAWKLRFFAEYAFSSDNTKEQEVALSFMDSYMEESVRKTEKECHKRCEYCGCEIGTDYSERCETHGWIQYICKDCAKEHNLEYFNEAGDVCNPDGSIKITAEEYKKRFAKISENIKEEDCDNDEQ